MRTIPKRYYSSIFVSSDPRTWEDKEWTDFNEWALKQNGSNTRDIVPINDEDMFYCVPAANVAMYDNYVVRSRVWKHWESNQPINALED